MIMILIYYLIFIEKNIFQFLKYDLENQVLSSTYDLK